MTRTIYGLWAITQYEGSALIRTYADEWAAKADCRSMVNYQNTKPKCPDDDSDAAFDVFVETENKWIAAHPGGKTAAYADYFDVFTTELIEP